MRREANGHARIACPQEINLAELELVARRRIDRHAMHDGKRAAVMLQQAGEVVEILTVETGRRGHDGFVRLHDTRWSSG